MAFHTPSIPFLGQVFAYIYDFCTYKKKWNVKISFSRIEKKNNEYHFIAYLQNCTSYHVDIGAISTEKGELWIGESKINDLGEQEFIFVKIPKEKFRIGWDKLLPNDNEKSDLWYSQGTEVRLKYVGEKTKLRVQFEMSDFPDSIFLNNKRTASRIIPF